MKIWFGAALWLAAFVLTACGGASRSDEAAMAATAPDVLAVYRGGEITVGDLDRAVLDLPAAERRLETQPVTRYEELIRRLVLDRLILAAAIEAGAAEDRAFQFLERESRRSAVMEQYLKRQRLLPPPTPIAEAALRARYEQDRDRFQRRARRLVSHLFLRRDDAEGDDVQDDAALTAAATALRQRLVAGESFAELAREHSDSESRHRDGVIGWIGRADFPAPLATVIFALQVGEPSQPIVTKEGVHLFLVKNAIEAKTFRFEEVERQLVREIRAAQRSEAVAQLVAALPLPPDSFVPTAEELRFLAAAGDPEAIVLRIGDYTLDVRQLSQRLAQARRREGAQQRPIAAIDLITHLERRERIYLHAEASGFSAEPEIVRLLATRREQGLGRYYRQRQLTARLVGKEEAIATFYENNKLRFSGPLRLQVRRLIVPLAAAEDANVAAEDANVAMARLEAARAELSRGAVELAVVANELGGTIEELGWQTTTQLRRHYPRAMRFAPQLAAGGYSPPYRTEHALALLAVTDRQEPAPLPFESVRDAVRQAYLESEGQEIYGAWSAELLAAAELRIFRDRLATLAASGLPPTADTPEAGADQP